MYQVRAFLLAGRICCGRRKAIEIAVELANKFISKGKSVPGPWFANCVWRGAKTIPMTEIGSHRATCCPEGTHLIRKLLRRKRSSIGNTPLCLPLTVETIYPGSCHKNHDFAKSFQFWSISAKTATTAFILPPN